MTSDVKNSPSDKWKRKSHETAPFIRLNGLYIVQCFGARLIDYYQFIAKLIGLICQHFA